MTTEPRSSGRVMSRRGAFGAMLVVALVAACDSSSKTRFLSPSPVAPVDKPVPASLFERDQPRTAALISWNDGLVVKADTLYALDLAAGRATPLRFPGDPMVVGVATQGTTPIALASSAAAGLHLLVKESGGWIERAVPDAARDEASAMLLAADEASVVLLGPRVVYHLQGGQWTTLRIDEPPVGPAARGLPSTVLLAGDTLYAGYARGEWGGGLAALDLATGAWSAVEGPGGRALALPCRHLVEAGGKRWAVGGLAHMVGQQGLLATFEGRSWTPVAEVDNLSKTSNGWDQALDSFEGLAFDAEGRPLVVTGHLGVLRADAPGKWTRLTPGWPKSDYVYVSALGVVGTTLVIVTYDAGVLLWDYATGDVRRVALR